MRRDAVREYLKGALWAYPTGAVILAIALGATLSRINVPPHTRFDFLVFQGTADDARTLLIAISSTIMTVIALVLGLTIVALQLSSTQYSPRLLRTFLRDRTNQLVISVFVATFAFSAAGLYTVGVSAGERVNTYPRLAVTFALVLMFASLVMVVYFVDHLSHTIQVDGVMSRVEQATLRVIEHDLPQDGVIDGSCPEPPEWAVPVPSYDSGYVQTLAPGVLLAAARRGNVAAAVTPMLGEHIVRGAPLAWVWHETPGEPPPDPGDYLEAVHDAVRLGFERTQEQDVAFGIRQLADIAVKALSPAVNDPYTAIQAMDHMSVLLSALAPLRLGSQHFHEDDGTLRLVVHGRDLHYFLDLAVGQARRYGGSEPRVLLGLIRVLRVTGTRCRDDAGRAEVATQVRQLVDTAHLQVQLPADLAPVQVAADATIAVLELPSATAVAGR